MPFGRFKSLKGAILKDSQRVYTFCLSFNVCLLLVAESAGDAKRRGNKELGAENVRNATNVVFSQQMAQHAVARGGNVIMNYTNDII
ncbi:hypothetical protein CEXT_203371 [Caerostris extrusa]|uniref:Uncharacterized protein n=1 Tax=Caerostris extrusa TaxID=172846 RepID=A0AAV4R770_CAEEX|nr:hypothetical protein CEXT_203371 [Caerostris extrusa]